MNGKRCLGGMLELLSHCHYLVATEDARLGFPEVTLPVVPGMEGCHWPFRKSGAAEWPRLLAALLGGAPVKATDATGWLVDYAGPLDAALRTAWAVANGDDHGLKRRAVEKGALAGMPNDVPGLPEPEAPTALARAAIMECVQRSCAVPLAEALGVEALLAGAFMASKACRAGAIGEEFSKTMEV